MSEASSSLDPRTPVIIGVGQILNRVDQGSDPYEPAKLMAQALLAAQTDSGADAVLASAQVVAAVPTISWRYSNPGALVREQLGCVDAKTWYATVGGNTPQSMVNRLAAAISAGEFDLALLCGGESGKSRSAAKKLGLELDWTNQSPDETPDWMDESPFFMGHPSEAARGILMPLQVYPLFENALWQDSSEPPIRVVLGSDHGRTPGLCRQDLVRVLSSCRAEPVRMEPHLIHRRRDHNPNHTESDDRVSLYQTNGRQPRCGHGLWDHLVLRGAGPRSWDTN